jgi:hypothetical protein
MESNPTHTTYGDATPENQLEIVAGRVVLDQDKFDCPLCRSTSYWQIHVTGRGGQDFKLPMCQCAGCSVVFTDAWRFKRLMQRTVDPRGFPEEKVTRGLDDRPRPNWQAAFWKGETPPGGWTKREVDP